MTWRIPRDQIRVVDDAKGVRYQLATVSQLFSSQKSEHSLASKSQRSDGTSLTASTGNRKGLIAAKQVSVLQFTLEREREREKEEKL